MRAREEPSLASSPAEKLDGLNIVLFEQRARARARVYIVPDSSIESPVPRSPDVRQSFSSPKPPGEASRNTSASFSLSRAVWCSIHSFFHFKQYGTDASAAALQRIRTWAGLHSRLDLSFGEIRWSLYPSCGRFAFSVSTKACGKRLQAEELFSINKICAWRFIDSRNCISLGSNDSRTPVERSGGILK